MNNTSFAGANRAMDQELLKAQKRISDLEAERAHIIWQYDENLNCGLRISTKLEEAEKRIKELEARDQNGNEIIEKYRGLHVKQHRQIQASRDDFLLVTEKLAKVEGERNHLYSALEELVACKDAAGPSAFPGPGYRWDDAWSDAQDALSKLRIKPMILP